MRTEKQRQWSRHIEAQSKSGMNVVSFCRTNNLSKDQFTYYKRKFAKEESLVSAKLVPVKIVPSRPRSIEIEGVKLSFGGELPIGLIAELVMEVKNRRERS